MVNGFGEGGISVGRQKNSEKLYMQQECRGCANQFDYGNQDTVQKLIKLSHFLL